MSADSVIVGIKPWLPAPLANSAWWTVPVAAERLAAVRIGLGLTLIFDVLTTYLPQADDFFGNESLTGTTAFAAPLSLMHRLLLMPVGDPWIWTIILAAWAVSGVFLVVGLLPRFAAAFAWFLSASLIAMNPMLHNAGDQVRTILLLLMAVAPCGTAWSMSRPRHAAPFRDVRIYPWPLRLLLVQMSAIYFMNGLFKALGGDWRSGNALAVLLGDSGWIRFPVADWPVPAALLSLADWTVLAWELTFPFLVRVPQARVAVLLLGVAFHVVTGLTMRVGMFPEYMLCMYLMFIPWERMRVTPASTKVS